MQAPPSNCRLARDWAATDAAYGAGHVRAGADDDELERVNVSTFWQQAVRVWGAAGYRASAHAAAANLHLPGGAGDVSRLDFDQPPSFHRVELGACVCKRVAFTRGCVLGVTLVDATAARRVVALFAEEQAPASAASASSAAASSAAASSAAASSATSASAATSAGTGTGACAAAPRLGPVRGTGDCGGDCAARTDRQQVTVAALEAALAEGEALDAAGLDGATVVAVWTANPAVLACVAALGGWSLRVAQGAVPAALAARGVTDVALVTQHVHLPPHPAADFVPARVLPLNAPAFLATPITDADVAAFVGRQDVDRAKGKGRGKRARR